MGVIVQVNPFMAGVPKRDNHALYPLIWTVFFNSVDPRKNTNTKKKSGALMSLDKKVGLGP